MPISLLLRKDRDLSTPRELEWRKALLNSQMALTLLQFDYPEQLLALIESGKLLAFNVALRSVPVRRDLRFLGQSIFDLINGRENSVNDPKEAFEIIFAELTERPAIKVKQVASRLAVSTDHVLKLARAGELTLIRGSAIRRGPKGSPLVQLSSVAGWLERRVLK